MSATSDPGMGPFYGWYDGLKRHRKGFPALGTIAGALVVLERLKENPGYDIEDHLAKGRAQIKGASGQAVRAILASFGEHRPFLAEGGRTNRGLRADMESLLKVFQDTVGDKESDEERRTRLQRWQRELVEKVRAFHGSQRLKFVFDSRVTTTEHIAALLRSSAEERKEGIVAQYLVGAKLQLRFPEISIGNESYSTSDAQSGRFGDFLVGDTAFHVSVAPTSAHFDKCLANLREGIRPFLLVPKRIENGLETLLRNTIDQGITVGDIESFVATNVEELSGFDSSRAAVELAALLQLYNRRVDAVEFDKSLLIEIPENLKRLL
jgi:hypothetical protein